MPKKRAGLPPGSVVFTGDQKVEKVSIHQLLFNANKLEEKEWSNHNSIKASVGDAAFVNWFDIRGLHDTALLEAIGQFFKVHPLALEDVADVRQRPKFEEYEAGNFILLKALHFDEKSASITTEQVSIYFNSHSLVSFQEDKDDLFIHIRKRLHAAKGKIRTRGTDYLAYALMDSLVDHYYIVLDKVELQIENLELEIQQKPSSASKARIYALKQQLLTMRRSVVPLRETINRFSRSESELLSDSSDVFLRDLYDHVVHVMDILENYRDLLNGLHDLYLTEISFQQNKVMQLLTVITTIFVPLSFLAGLYGMNFDYMPELHFQYGYFILLGVMGIVFVGALWYFKRKKWL